MNVEVIAKENTDKVPSIVIGHKRKGADKNTEAETASCAVL